MVLVVDDHADICFALEKLIRGSNFSVKCLTEPLLAIDNILELRPTVLILDQMMPAVSGVEILRQMRGTPAIAHTPTIFFSACETGMDEAEKMDATWVKKNASGWDDLLALLVEIHQVA